MIYSNGKQISNDPEQAVFDKLRRCSYEDACIIYCVEALRLPASITFPELEQILNPILIKTGWTVEDMNIEGERRLLNGE